MNDNNRSQLLVTTHYDPLLDSLDVNDLFGKDSVWFTEKKGDGNTELYPLTDFKGLSKLSSIRKSYKNGQFGAVPVPIRYNLLRDDVVFVVLQRWLGSLLYIFIFFHVRYYFLLELQSH